MNIMYSILTQLGIAKSITLIVLFLSIFIDITPKIKWNPIKAIIGYLGNCFNNSIEKEISTFKEEVNTKFDELRQEQESQRETLNKIILDQENKEISRLRWEIIDFENSIQNGHRYSREHYRHVLDDAEKYKRMMSNNINNDTDDGEIFSEVLEIIERIDKHYTERRDDPTILFF